MPVPGSDLRPRGFRLIELAIILAIVAIAISLVFAWCLRARESAAIAACTDNLRGIGTALQNFQGGNPRRLVGFDPKRKTTIFAWMADRDDLDRIPPDSNTYLLCPSRRNLSSVTPGQAPCDYGWSDDPNSVLGRNPDTPRKGQQRVGRLILLGHIGIRPEDYGGGEWDGPYTTNGPAYARTPAPLYLDKDLPDSRNWMGSPHPTGVPFLLCDNSVTMIEYGWCRDNPEEFARMWQVNREPAVPDVGQK
jgi:type II secretory pathway pseudopilin PulG